MSVAEEDLELAWSPRAGKDRPTSHARRPGERFELCGGYLSGRAVLAEKPTPQGPVCGRCGRTLNSLLDLLDEPPS